MGLPTKRRAVSFPQYFVTGGTGQVGAFFPRSFAAESLLMRTRETFDITRHDKVVPRLRALSPTAIINCAAITSHRQTETTEGRLAAWAVNARAAAVLARTAAELNVPFIQLSTDQVFGRDFQRKTPFTEVDSVEPLTFLGQTKTAAEHALLELQVRYPEWRCYILRVANVFELCWRPRRNFPFQLVGGLTDRRIDKVPVVHDVFVSLSFVPDIVRAMKWLLEHLTTVPAGIYHVVNEGHPSWYDVGLEIARRVHCRGQLEPVDRYCYARQHRLDPETRANYTCLSAAKFNALPDAPALPPWQAAVIRWVDSYKRWKKDAHEEPDDAAA